MTQPQDPWGQSQPGQQPQQPYSFPQAGYGQPNTSQQPYGTPQYQQPQQQNQYPQVGYFGGAPEPKKKGMPWWGWVLVVFVAIVVIGGIGSAIRSGSTTTATPQALGQQVVATAAPVPTQRAAQATAAPTAAASTSKVDKLGIRAQGAGQELVGQGGTDNDLKITVASVDRFSQLTDFTGKTIQSQGAFLVVSYDVENVGTEPHSFFSLNIVDGKGRKFSSTTNLDAVSAVAFSGAYKTDMSIQPSFKGKGYSVIEIPADASNLKLKLGF